MEIRMVCDFMFCDSVLTVMCQYVHKHNLQKYQKNKKIQTLHLHKYPLNTLSTTSILLSKNIFYIIIATILVVLWPFENFTNFL